MKPNNPRIERHGIDLNRKSLPEPPLRGKDFPAGIEHLDLKWFEDCITLEAIAQCRSVDDLERLKNDALWVLELRKLKKLAE